MNNDENHCGGDFSKVEYIPRIQNPPQFKSMIHKIVVDTSAIVFVLIPILCLYIWGQPYKRGFNCDDDSLRYPFLDNTISSVVLYFYSTLIPLCAICVNEFFILRYQYPNNQELSSLFTSKPFWRSYLWQVYLQLAPLAFAAASSQLVTDIAKYSIGRLRPHFIDQCRPQLSNGQILYRTSNCDNPHAYIDDYQCTKDVSQRLLRDSRLSFMSGHSSFAAVCLIYLVIYIQVRVKWPSLGLIKSFLQFTLACLVIYTGLSRVSDYKHHWSDVLTGLIQGTITAILVALFVSDLFKIRSYRLSRPNSIASPNQIDPESGV